MRSASTSTRRPWTSTTRSTGSCAVSSPVGSTDPPARSPCASSVTARPRRMSSRSQTSHSPVGAGRQGVMSMQLYLAALLTWSALHLRWHGALIAALFMWWQRAAARPRARFGKSPPENPMRMPPVQRRVRGIEWTSCVRRARGCIRREWRRDTRRTTPECTAGRYRRPGRRPAARAGIRRKAISTGRSISSRRWRFSGSPDWEQVHSGWRSARGASLESAEAVGAHSAKGLRLERIPARRARAAVVSPGRHAAGQGGRERTGRTRVTRTRRRIRGPRSCWRAHSCDSRKVAGRRT